MTSSSGGVCMPGQTQACYTGGAGTENVGTCKGGTQTCLADSTWSTTCDGEVTPKMEDCATPEDDECDGTPNEVMDCGVCTPADTQDCYSGDPATQNVGICVGGTQTCDNAGMWGTTCDGEVTPMLENCGTPEDDDCDGEVNELADCPCAAGCPAGSYDIDGNPLTGMCGCEYQCNFISNNDPIDDTFTDQNCDGTDGPAEQCVFVSASEGSDSNNGTRLMPMQTIGAAIQKASMLGLPAVCLSGEIYNENVTVVSGISILGGFDHTDPDFKFRRKMGVVSTVQASGIVFNAPQIDLPTSIAGIEIQAMSNNLPSNSTYGIRLGGGMDTLTVTLNTISVGAGGNGTNGVDGAPHANPTAGNGNNGSAGAEQNNNSGFGGAAPNCAVPGGKGGDGGADSASGQNGNPGTGGTPGGNGAGSNSCTPAIGSPGTPGGNGQNGANAMQGNAGTGGNALGTIIGQMYAAASGQNGIVGGNGNAGGGAGGGGGGSGGGLCFGAWDKGGGGGSGGCGGLGGNFGNGGGGGGGSFGIFAAGGKVTVTKNTITTSSGGNGGKGGNGALGQNGGVGGNGGANSDDSGPGGKGGNGGKGAAGGPGGGGGGGPSACLARSGAVTFQFMTNTCVVGVPGFGGAGGTNPEGGIGGAGNNGTANANLQIN